MKQDRQLSLNIPSEEPGKVYSRGEQLVPKLDVRETAATLAEALTIKEAPPEVLAAMQGLFSLLNRH